MENRRKLLESSMAALTGSGLGLTGASAFAQSDPKVRQVVIRVSRGSFDPSKADEWERRLTQSGDSLMPAIKKLKGLIQYYSGIDKLAGSMIQVSIWESLEAAKQMETLPAMMTAGREFVAAGVTFERPIINYQSTWLI